MSEYWFSHDTAHIVYICSISAIAEKLQAVVPMSSGQMAVRPVTLVASLSNQLHTAGQQTLKSPGATTPQQLAAAAQAGHQAAHQLVSAMAAQAQQNTSQTQSGAVGVLGQVGMQNTSQTQSGDVGVLGQVGTAKYLTDTVGCCWGPRTGRHSKIPHRHSRVLSGF